MNLIIVDDEISCLNSLEIALQPLHFNIIKETNPLEVMNLIKNNQTDLVITDVRMPGLNGIELLKKIKLHNRKIDVIVITAFGDLDTAIECINNKAYAFFPKPIDVEEFIETVREIEKERSSECYEMDCDEIEKLRKENEKLKDSYKKLLQQFQKIIPDDGEE